MDSGLMPRILAILLLTCGIAVAQISQQTIVNEITANLPTNNIQEISAELLRNTLNQMTSAIFQNQGLSGFTIIGTPAIGQTIIATSTTTASWQSIGGLITSVSNSDGSLNVSPTTGNVIASINTNNANTWTQLQNFNAGLTGAVNGVNVTGAPSTGFVPIATNSASATWGNLFTPAIGQTQNGINSFNGTMNSSGTQTQSLFYSGSSGASPGFSIGTTTIGLNAINGGVNANNGPKTNYSAMFGNMVAATQGQVSALQTSTLHFSNGDSSILDGIVYSYGNTANAGDEGTEGLVLGVLQGPVVFTATVSGIAGNAVSYTSPTNEFSRGEARPLINTTPAKVYSTGTVTAVSGNPSVVTGSGTAWGTTFGTGSFTNLWLAIDSQTNGALMLVIPIASIASDTSLTLGYMAEGVSSGIPAPTLPSTYKIFKGSTVSSIDAVTVGGQTIPVLGHVNVNSIVDYTVGDTVQQPLGYALGLLGARIAVSPQLPCASNIGCYGLNLSNIGTVPLTAFGAFSGTVANGLIFQGTNTGHVIDVVNRPVNGALVASGDFTASVTTRMLGVPTSVGSNTFLTYENTADTWATAKPFQVPLTTVTGLSSFPCNGTSRGARMGVTDAMSTTWQGSLTGGNTGAVAVIPVWCNGSAWVAG